MPNAKITSILQNRNITSRSNITISQSELDNYNPKTNQSLRPDFNHKPLEKPHWDWKDSNGEWWRLYRFLRTKK